MAEFCGHQKAVDECEPQSVVTPSCQQADIQFPSEQITVTDKFILTLVITPTKCRFCHKGFTVTFASRLVEINVISLAMLLYVVQSVIYRQHQMHQSWRYCDVPKNGEKLSFNPQYF